MRPPPYYAFYPETAAGASLSLEVVDLESDDLARAWAQDVLREHASAACVEIWCGDRHVGRVAPARPAPFQATAMRSKGATCLDQACPSPTAS